MKSNGVPATKRPHDMKAAFSNLLMIIDDGFKLIIKC
jgi:hypothetical protein